MFVQIVVLRARLGADAAITVANGAHYRKQQHPPTKLEVAESP